MNKKKSTANHHAGDLFAVLDWVKGALQPLLSTEVVYKHSSKLDENPNLLQQTCLLGIQLEITSS
jgi:hypothetical protein